MVKRARDYFPSKYEAARKRRVVGAMLQSAGIRRMPPPRAITVVPRSYGNARTMSERKYFETERSLLGLAQVTTAWTGTELDPATTLSFFSPVQGTDIINRIGRKVHILNWKVRGFLNFTPLENQTTANDASICRIIFYVDQQSNGTQSQGEDVITSNQAQGTPAEPGICMWQNKNNFGRFKVLKDKMYILQDPNAGSVGATYDTNGRAIPFKFNFKFKKPIEVIFNQTNGGTIADIVNNSLHCIGGQNVVDLQVTISYKSRVTFIDV